MNKPESNTATRLAVLGETRPARPLAPTPTQPKRQRRPRGLSGFYQNCKSALQSVRANKMRSLLTSLGIIIGVAAVIVIISISEASTASINSRLSNLNPTEIIVRPGSSNAGGGVRQGAGSVQTLTQADADAIAAQVSNVSAVSPVLNVSGQVVFQNQNWPTTTQGVYPDYQQIGSWQMQEGTFLQSEQGMDAVIGQTVVTNLFTPLGIDPLGKQIRIGSVSFTVVGVLASKGGSSFGNADDVVYVPFTTAQQQLSGHQYVNSIDVTASDPSQVTTVQTAVQTLLEQRHSITNPQNDDFTIQNQAQVLSTVQGTTQTLTTLLVGVASISLIVGGIGIMNIMLVSVTERTREIGIRMAIGARPRDVLSQFLIEAVMLSVLGGAVGVLLGIGGGVIFSALSQTSFVLSPIAVLLAFGFAGAVGVVFGYYPARRAASLDPIVALRTE
ncbi:MAG TPA: ABC transporter permease [Ktedonobacteraceae bacterium]|nr:ABC transporter permease [Ktedonobacteraceae bacterium]